MVLNLRIISNLAGESYGDTRGPSGRAEIRWLCRLVQRHPAYQNNKVETSSPAELTLMLYNGALKFSGLAKKAMNDGHIAESNTNILKVQNIVRIEL